jgi:hypothetical protein
MVIGDAAILRSLTLYGRAFCRKTLLGGSTKCSFECCLVNFKL